MISKYKVSYAEAYREADKTLSARKKAGEAIKVLQEKKAKLSSESAQYDLEIAELRKECKI